MQSLYEYLDYRILLKDLLEEKKRGEPWFSYRLLSKRIGISSSGFLSLAIAGKRNITQDLAIKLCTSLKFSKKESSFFLALVRYTQASTSKEKEFAFEELLAFRKVKVTSLNADQQEFYRHWYYSAMRELISVTAVSDSNLQRVARQFKPTIRVSEVKESLELLLRLKLIIKESDGTYKRSSALITASNAPIAPSFIHRYQSEVIDLARNALHFIPKESRDISTVTLSTNETGANLIKKRVEQCRMEIMSIAKQSNDPDRIMQLNIQLFPLWDNEDRSE